MEITDFNEEIRNHWVSKEKLCFKNDKIEFNYVWVVDIFEYQPGWSVDIWNTRYTVAIMVDKDSRHDTHKDEFLQETLYTFPMKIKEIHHKRHNQKYLEKILATIDNMKIEPKLKKDNYKKIKAIINGGSFMV